MTIARAQRDALALAARQLDRPAGPELGEPYEVERALGAGSPLGARDLAHLHPVFDVFAHGHVREERVVLEHRVDVAQVRRLPRHVGATQLDRAFVGKFEPGDHPQQRGLAGARRSEHREELAVGNLEVDAVGGNDTAEALPDSREADRAAHLGDSIRRN